MAKKNDLLLAIDFQNIYLPGQEWACPSMPGSIENVRKLITSGQIGHILFTQYLAAQQPVGTWKTYNEEYRHLNEDPYLCDIVEELKPFLAQYPLAVKSTYSSLKCGQVLEAAGKADAVVLTGVVAECCILATLMEGIDLGCKMIYLYDACSGQTPENEAAIRRIAESFAPMHTLVMSTEEYLNSL